MLTSELTEYLRSLKEMNPPPAEVDLREALFSAGWNEHDILEALDFLKKPTTPPKQEASPSVVSSKSFAQNANPNHDLIQSTVQKSSTSRLPDLSLPELESPHQTTPLSLDSKVVGANLGEIKTSVGEINVTPKYVGGDGMNRLRPEESAFSMRKIEDEPWSPPVQAKPISSPVSPKVVSKNSSQPVANPFAGTSSRSFIGMDNSQFGTPKVSGVKVSDGAKSPSSKNLPENLTAPHRSVGKLIAVILLVVIVLGGGAGGAFAYFKGWITLPSFLTFSKPYSEDEFLAKLFEKFQTINSASYEVSVSGNVVARDADAKPFSVDVSSADQELALSYKRDQDRFRALSDLKDSLTLYWKSHKNTYPDNLSKLNSAPKDPSSVDFDYKKHTSGGGGDTYDLKITFETGEAISAIKSQASLVPLQVQNKTVTFTATSPSEFNFSGEPEKPALLKFISQNDDTLNIIPADLKLRVALSGNTHFGTVEDKNTGLNFRGVLSFDTSNLKIDVDAEMINLGGALGDYYVRLNKFPTSFSFVSGNFSALLGSWVKLDSDVLGSQVFDGGLDGESGTKDSYETTKDLYSKAFKSLLKIATEEKVVVFVNPPVKEKVSDATLYRYDIFLDRSKISSFLKRVEAEFSKIDSSRNYLKFSQDVMDTLQGKDFAKVFDYLKNNNKVSVWIDANTGMPVKFSVKSRIVPGEKVMKLSDKQLNTSFELALSHINEPIVARAPAEFITQEDATLKFTGENRDSYRFKKQVGSVEALRAAIDNYKKYSGSFPLTLQDLKKKGSELEIQKVVTKSQELELNFVEAQFKNQSFIKTIPKDVFTGADYEYSKIASDYSLVYNLTLPSYKNGANPADFYATNGVAVPGKIKYILKYVFGKNTATAKSISTEAVEAGKADGDKDMVSDTLEVYIGTDSKKKDTDGDGYSDASELTRGSNPNGPGNLEGVVPSLLPLNNSENVDVVEEPIVEKKPVPPEKIEIPKSPEPTPPPEESPLE